MKNLNIILLSTIMVLITATSVFAQQKKANLLLFPTILELNDRDRKGSINVINRGDARGLYSIEFVDTEMVENGTLVHLDEDVQRDYSLKPIARISPRRMILEPGQSQKVRFIIRKPKGLPDGEYRSHLKVKLIESNVDEKGRPMDVIKNDTDNIIIAPKARSVTAIPIFVRFGEMEPLSATLTNVKYSVIENRPTVNLQLNSQISRTIKGEMRVNYIDENGKETVVALHPASIYYPTKSRTVHIGLNIPDGITIGKGTLHISYIKEATKTKEETVIAETKIQL